MSETNIENSIDQLAARCAAAIEEEAALADDEKIITTILVHPQQLHYLMTQFVAVPGYSSEENMLVIRETETILKRYQDYRDCYRDVGGAVVGLALLDNLLIGQQVSSRHLRSVA